MLKQYLLLLFLLLSYSGFSQTEKGVWSVNGKMDFRKYIPEFNSLRTPPSYQFSGELDIGLFVKKDNFIGLKASISPFDRQPSRKRGVRYEYNKRRIFQAAFRRCAGLGKLRMYWEVAGRYAAYVERISEKEKTKDEIFALTAGIGLTYFVNPNIALEFQLNTPLWMTVSTNNRDFQARLQTRLFLNSRQPYQTDTIDLMFDYFERGYFSIGLHSDLDFSLDKSRPIGNAQVNFALFFAESYRINAFVDITRRNNEEDGSPYFGNNASLSLEYISLFYNKNWLFAQTGFGTYFYEDAYLFVGFGFGFPIKNKGFWRIGMNGQHNYQGNNKLHFFLEREFFIYQNLSLKGNIYYKTKPFNAESYEVNQADYGLRLGFNYFVLRKSK